jgi:hypothetical protein
LCTQITIVRRIERGKFQIKKVEVKMQPDGEQSNVEMRGAWLASVLMRRDRPFLARLAQGYYRLLHLPRQARRLLQRRLAVTLAGAALLLALGRAPARAATIDVVDGEVAIADNGRCSLIEAIRNANDTNNGMIYDDCAAGDPTYTYSGDIINLPPGGIFTITAATGDYYDAASGLPLVTSRITIEGSGSTIRRDPTNPARFRLLAVGDEAYLELKELVLIGGDSTAGGGAVHVEGGLFVSDCTLNNNQATGVGGAISLGGYNSSATILRSVLSGNRASEGGAIGGAFTSPFDDRYSWNHVSIDDSTLTGNIASDGGGGALFGGSIHVAIRNSIVSGNRTNSAGGGFDLVRGGSVIDSTFSENQAYGGGAIFNAAGSRLWISNSTFENNEAVNNGGGIVNFWELSTVNSTFSGNAAGQNGGGIYNSHLADVVNSTLTGNSAQRGGGIFNYPSWTCSVFCRHFDGIVTLARSLVSGNVAGDGGRELFNGGETYDGTIEANNYNLFGYSGDPGLANVDLQPLDVVPDQPLAEILDPLLADNNGSTQTHRLLENSPALDVAPNEACNIALNGMDQRGWRRNVNRVGEVSDNDCDIGAFELQDIRSVFTPVVAR